MYIYFLLLLYIRVYIYIYIILYYYILLYIYIVYASAGRDPVRAGLAYLAFARLAGTGPNLRKLERLEDVKYEHDD